MSSIQTEVVTTGVDPHPTTHTAAALDDNGKILESLIVSHSSKGCRSSKRGRRTLESGALAVEGIGNHYIYPFVVSLLNQQERVYAISTNLTSQYRTRGNR